MRGATQQPSSESRRLPISIHAPHTGCDAVDLLRSRSIIGFQSTHPIRGATFLLSSSVHASNISIHAPHTGCDAADSPGRGTTPNFNPRTPYGVRRRWRSTFRHTSNYFNPRTPYGVRLDPVTKSGVWDGFQSTHPIRGATTALTVAQGGKTNFNPRTPYGVRHLVVFQGCNLTLFQSTHPIRGATRPGNRRTATTWVFQSTHPIRGATVHSQNQAKIVNISIHAPHTGCDGKFDDFNPLNLHKRYKRVLDRPKSTSEQGKNKAKLAYIHVFTVFGGCEGAGTVCALLLRTQYC